MNHTIELALLGGLTISTGDAALPEISAGSQRLLAFLALRDRVARHRDPDEFSDGSESLRSAVSRLEGSVRQAVEVTADDVRLAEGVAVDVHHARSLARTLIDGDGPPSQADIGTGAISILAKDLLPGWYDDWAVIAGRGMPLKKRTIQVALADLKDAGLTVTDADIGGGLEARSPAGP